MSYERFSELWDALITNRPGVGPVTMVMTKETKDALVDYANGNTAKIDAVRNFLSKQPS
jgi:hypothetical protein